MKLIVLVVDVIVIACFFGVIGSLASRAIRATSPTFNSAEYWDTFPKYVWGFVGESLIGAAAALAGLLLIVAIGGVESVKSDDWNSADEVLRIVAISVIFGFGARRLFPMLVDDIVEKLKRNEKAIADLDRDVEIDDENIRLNGAVKEAIDGNENDVTKRYTLRKAVEYISEGDAQPFLYVNTARLYRHLGQLDDAIKLLLAMLGKRSQLKDSKYDNFNTATYNLACYYTLKGEYDTAAKWYDEYMSESDDKKSAYSEAKSDPDLENFFQNFPDRGKS